MLTEQEIANIEAGFYGVEFISDTAAHLGPFGILTPIETTVISVLICDRLKGNALTGENLPAGIPIRIPLIKSVTLTSGALLAHRMPPRISE